MSTNVDAIIKEGIRAYKANKKQEARTLFEKATELDSYNEQGWLWLSAVVDTEEDQRVCLENVLFINPDNAAAKKGLAKLKPVADTSSDDDYDLDIDVPPTATSSASSIYNPDEPSSQEYDDWVSSLNINEANRPPVSSPFTTMDFDDENAFSGAFTSEFGDEDEPFDDPFGDDPFSAGVDYDSDEFEVDNSFGDQPFSSPSFDASIPDFTPAQGSNKQAKAKANEIVDNLFASDSSSSSGAFYNPDAVDSYQTSDETDPIIYFREIPKSIKATRLPGTAEPASPVMLIGVVVLVLLNLGALGMLVMKFVG